MLISVLNWQVLLTGTCSLILDARALHLHLCSHCLPKPPLDSLDPWCMLHICNILQSYKPTGSELLSMSRQQTSIDLTALTALTALTDLTAIWRSRVVPPPVVQWDRVLCHLRTRRSQRSFLRSRSRRRFDFHQAEKMVGRVEVEKDVELAGMICTSPTSACAGHPRTTVESHEAFARCFCGRLPGPM